jgi:hypothetical protein
MRPSILIPVILLTLLTPALLTARIYIWTDAEGIKHFSQEPPPEQASEVMVQDELQYDPSADAKQRRNESDPNASPPQSQPSKSVAGRQQTRIVLEGNVILVPTTLSYGGRQIDTQLVLDTGASSTILHAPLADRLGIRPAVNTKVRIASGEMINAQAVTMEAIQAGPHTLRGARTLIIRHQGPQTAHQGLLGLNFLGQYPYSLDMRSMVINWGADIPAAGP